MFYLFHRFIKDLRNEIPMEICTTIIDSIRDLLIITAEIPEEEEPETDLLTEAIQNSTFDSQLYLFETIGILCSLIYKTPAQQSSVLLSLVKPLMDDLSFNFQAFRTQGPSDLLPIVKVHHIIMALGNIAKGFPDYPPVLHADYILPPLDVFTQMAQAILVCLEAMNIFKPIRDAVSPDDFLTFQIILNSSRVDSICIRPHSCHCWTHCHPFHPPTDEQSASAFRTFRTCRLHELHRSPHS